MEGTAEPALNGSPKLKSDDKLRVPLSVAGEIGESGNGVSEGERGVASVPGDWAFVDIGVL